MKIPLLLCIFHRYLSLDSQVVESDAGELPPSEFTPNLFIKTDSGDFESVWGAENCVCNFEDGSLTSRDLEHYIRQLFAYMQESGMTFKIFFGRDFRDNYPGEIFEYCMLLIERYLQLLESEQAEADEEPKRLSDLCDDEEEAFEQIKIQAKVLLKMLELTSLEFRENADIMPKLHRVIDVYLRLFPDALYLVVLAKFREDSFEFLLLNGKEECEMGITTCISSFRYLKFFQILVDFREFQKFSFFTPKRLPNIFGCLLTNGLMYYYTMVEKETATVNFCAFFIQTLPFEEAYDILNQLITLLEKQEQIVFFILKAISVIECERFRRGIHEPAFPIHHVKTLEALVEYFDDDLRTRHKPIRLKLEELCPNKTDFIALIKAASGQSLVVRLVFQKIFSDLTFNFQKFLNEKVFDASVCGSIQSFSEHSKHLETTRELPSTLQLIADLSKLEKSRQANKDELKAIGITEGMRVSHVLKEVLPKARQTTEDTKQIQWRRICGESKPPNMCDSGYQQAVAMVDFTASTNAALLSSKKEFIREELFADIDLEIETIKAQLKPIDDHYYSISKENSALNSSFKSLICERLGLPRQE
jgi:hypothetical protein